MDDLTFGRDEKCDPDTEREIEWNTEGPQGPRGEQGLPGPRGERGLPGSGPGGAARVVWYSPSREISVTSGWPAFTNVTTVRIPAGTFLVTARFNVGATAGAERNPLTGALTFVTSPLVFLQMGSDKTALYAYSGERDNFKMAATLVTTVQGTTDFELSLEAALSDALTVTLGGGVLVQATTIVAHEISEIARSF
jgi:hypothetical protein